MHRRSNHGAIQDDGERDLFNTNILLSTGILVHGELPREPVEGFVPYGGLARTDLMIDMEGGHVVYSYDTLNSYILILMELVLLIGLALLFHPFGMKPGIFQTILQKENQA